MNWRTMRAAIAAMRADLRAKGRGGVIVVHRPDCGIRWGEPHDCQPRMQLVRAR